MSKKVSSREDEPMQRVFRQRELVDYTKHDNEILRLELTRESRDAKRSNSSVAASDISRLQEEASRYIKKIEGERKKVEELDLELAKYQEKILEQKSRLGGVNAVQVNNQLITKQIRMLENRMDKGLTKFNEILAQNKVLRQQIDEYRRERVVFDGIYKKLERELHEKKKEMAAIIEDSKNAYQARDKSQSEMAALRLHAEKEKGEFEKDFKELGDFIFKQQQMLEQLRLQQFDRASDKMKTQKDTSDAGHLQIQDDSSNWVGNKDKIAHLSQDKIHSFEDMLKKIQDATGIHDVNEVVTRFLEAEEQNFSLFNYVNDINSEIERLEHSITDMRNQIEKFRGQGLSSDTQRKKTLRDIEEKLNRTNIKAEEYENRYQQSVRVITQLKNGIHSIFTRIGAATSSLDEVLGNQGVTESNMMQYLGIIEQRTSEILQQYAASQNGTTSDGALQLPTVVHAEGAVKLTIDHYLENSEIGDDDVEGEDDEERPLTRQELEKRTIRDLNRKNTQN